MEDLARQTAENARRFQHLDRKLIMHASGSFTSMLACWPQFPERSVKVIS
jgi:hypothetical protein